jgi:hypothetical protein
MELVMVKVRKSQLREASRRKQENMPRKRRKKRSRETEALADGTRVYGSSFGPADRLVISEAIGSQVLTEDCIPPDLDQEDHEKTRSGLIDSKPTDGKPLCRLPSEAELGQQESDQV